MSDSLLPVLLAVPVVVLACQVGGSAVRLFGQPPVIGEVLAGILLGPSLLGLLAPSVQHHLLPPSVLPITSALGNLGLLTFLFLIGLELDLRTLGTSRGAVAAVSLSGVLLPMALGAGLAAALYPHFAPDGVGRLPFTLFVAVAVSITAFPVLARILADRGMETTPLGAFALACAATDDALAWCLLTAVVALSTSGTALSALTTLALTAAFAAGLTALRPALRALLERAGRTSDDLVLVLLFAGLCLSAYTTDQIGVHPAFGAFLFGACAPRGLRAVERSAARIRAVVLPLLLPLFFVDTGLHTDLSTLPAGQWGWGAAILGIAVIGKWGGAAGAARLTGFDWRWSAAVGTLMNCRGLTELVVLGIGIQIGVISEPLFTLLVVMTVITTAATAPILRRVAGDDPRMTPSAPHAESERDPAREATG
ncbi:cation:proton antiporter [Streptomyces turgidiscabies]|uniref:NapR2, putative sodium transporter n=1 Tax=Streptomyces turgidiscabies (strain Car8) TaxID=698760 RepID=L7F3D1_STRT8|nr:cation:proton antiporter [Streptomyces turgidiscabies]ELP65842.1 NapR2, putative sodium transporter [Streptomyces turgidiscabies Car8]MDX3498312.1 cation:proton antiporter [Streptomyces turgidiscabies]GAQ74457.1 high-affinity Na(+)/ H(+) antiporter NhaS3 [Streptomyces turgidiscabies]